MVDDLLVIFFYELICISVHGEQLCEHSKNLGQSCGSDMLIGAPPQGQKFFKKKKMFLHLLFSVLMMMTIFCLFFGTNWKL